MAKSIDQCVLDHLGDADPVVREKAADAAAKLSADGEQFSELVSREIMAARDNLDAEDFLAVQIIRRDPTTGKIDAETTQARLRSFMTYTWKDADVSVEFLYKEIFGRTLTKNMPRLYAMFKNRATAAEFSEAYFTDKSFRDELLNGVDEMASEVKDMDIGGADGMIESMKREMQSLQSTDAEKLLAMGKDAYVAKTLPLVRQTQEQVEQVFEMTTSPRNMWDERLKGSILTAEDYNAARTLDFTSRDSWMTYHKQFGQTADVGAMVFRAMSENARQIAIVQKFQSTNPRKVWNNLLARLKHEEVRVEGAGGEHLDEIGKNVFGDTSHWIEGASRARKMATNTSAGLSRLASLNVLGQAFFTAAGGDLAATYAQEIGTYGAKGATIAGGAARGGNYFGNLVKTLAHWRTLAHVVGRAGNHEIGQEIYEHLGVFNQVHNARLFSSVRFTSDALDANGALNKFTNFYYQHNLTTLATGASFYSGMTDIMTKVSKLRGTAYTELPDFLQRRLKSFRITPKEWDSLKDTDFVELGGVKFIDPNKLPRELGLKMKNFYLRNISFVVGEDSAALDAVMNMGLKKGHGWREGLALMWSLKSFAARSYMGMLEPILNSGRVLGVDGFRKTLGLSGAAAMSILMYQPLEVSRQMFNNLEDAEFSPDWIWERLSDPDTITRSLMYGSPLGIGNDLLANATSQAMKGGSPEQMLRAYASGTVMTPAMKAALDVADLGIASVQAFTGDEDDVKKWKAASGNVYDNYTPDIAGAHLVAQNWLNTDYRSAVKELKNAPLVSPEFLLRTVAR